MQPIVLYRHTQSSPVFATVVVGFFALMAAVLILAGEAAAEVLLIMGLTLVPVVIVVVGASALTTTVTSDEVHIRWRFGWPSRVIPRDEIVSAEAVRNRWWYGWGIRWTPHGWMWNVWGLDAVRLTRTSGKGFLIGTDDPEGLTAALS